MAQTQTIRPMNPSGRVVNRFHRAAVGHVARELKVDMLELDDICSKVRSAFAHLIAHDRYRTRIEDRIEGLMRKNRELLDHPEAARYFGELEMKKIQTTLEQVTRIRAALQQPQDEQRRQVLDSVDYLLDKARAAASVPGIVETLGKAKIKLIDKAAADLDTCRVDMLKEAGVSPRDIQLFIAVIDETRRGLESESWDSSDVLGQDSYLLAKMILTNFPAYDTTLNT